MLLVSFSILRHLIHSKQGTGQSAAFEHLPSRLRFRAQRLLAVQLYQGVKCISDSFRGWKRVSGPLLDPSCEGNSPALRGPLQQQVTL